MCDVGGRTGDFYFRHMTVFRSKSANQNLLVYSTQGKISIVSLRLNKQKESGSWSSTDHPEFGVENKRNIQTTKAKH